MQSSYVGMLITCPCKGFQWNLLLQGFAKNKKPLRKADFSVFLRGLLISVAFAP
jgi:hypothetical protein